VVFFLETLPSCCCNFAFYWIIWYIYSYLLTCSLLAISKFLFANYLQVKTHLQAKANAEIAVGHQHEHTGGMAGALRMIFVNHGLSGLWRGVSGAVIRVSVGSATQLTTFSWTKEQIVMLQVHSVHLSFTFYHAILCMCVTNHGPVSVSVTSRSSTKTAKRRIT